MLRLGGIRKKVVLGVGQCQLWLVRLMRMGVSAKVVTSLVVACKYLVSAVTGVILRYCVHCLVTTWCVCRDGFVTLQEYMAFMISRETENVQSAQDVEAAFRALTSNERPYIQAQELYSVSYHSNEIIAIV